MKNNGMFSNLLKKVSGNNVPKNEKRVIKLSQSEPFKPGGRPPNLNFQVIFTHEFEHVSDLVPALMAEVFCPVGLDCKLRLNVYYSSNITSQKEVLVAGATFSKRELLRTVVQMGVLVADMTSEYCVGAKAYIETVKHFPEVIQNKNFMITAKKSAKNPLSQRYVFYNESDKLTPIIDAEEFAWEPKFAAKVPLLFLDNFTTALIRSINAWNERYEAERMRQGRFSSEDEALRYGWHAVTVYVVAARVNSSRAQNERLKLATQQHLVNLQHQQIAMIEERQQAMVDQELYTGDPAGAEYAAHLRTASTASAGGGASSNMPLFHIHVPLEMETVPRSRTASASAARELDVDAKQALLQQQQYHNAQSGIEKRNAGKKAAVDHSAPCSFVELNIADTQRVFLSPVGRTNTEYYTMYPSYGSNINLSQGRKSSAAHVVANDTVKLSSHAKEFAFRLYETTDRDIFSRHNPKEVAEEMFASINKANGVSTSAVKDESGVNNRTASVERSRLQSESDPTIVTCIGKESKFCIFVPSCTDTHVQFDFCVEEGNTSKKRIGTCAVPLEANMDKNVWLPVIPRLSAEAPLFDDIELNVIISVRSPDAPDAVNVDNDSGSSCPKESNQEDQENPDSLVNVTANHGTVAVGNAVEAAGVAHNSIVAMRHAPSSLQYSYCYQRLPTGRHTSGSIPSKAEQVCTKDQLYSGHVISNSYEWMWQVGFNGMDPLVAIDPLGAAAPAPMSSSENHDNGQSTAHSQLSANDGEAAAHPPFAVPPASAAGDSRMNDDYENTADGGDGDYSGFRMRDSIFDAMTSSPLPTADDAVSFSTAESPLPLVSEGEAATASPESGTLIAGSSDLDDATATNASATTATTATIHFPTNGSPSAVTQPASFAVDVLKARVDVVYPLQWIRQHIEEMQELAIELRGLVPVLQRLVRADMSFRCSALKKTPEMQPLPINLHYQLLVVRSHLHHHEEYVDDDDDDDRAVGVMLTDGANETDVVYNAASAAIEDGRHQSQPEAVARARASFTRLGGDRVQRLETIHSVSCGSMSPHMLGHKKGGLFHQEGLLVAQREEIERLKSRFQSRVVLGAGGTRFLPVPGVSDCSTQGGSGTAFGLLEEIEKKLLKFESTCLKIARRRVYAISQSLSIAVNSLLLKLALTVEKHVPASLAEKWLSDGFLIVFEGLLSVVSHERSMLEDTISAVEALRSYQIRIKCMDQNYYQWTGMGESGSSAAAAATAREWAEANASSKAAAGAGGKEAVHSHSSRRKDSADADSDSDYSDDDDELHGTGGRHSIAAAATVAVANGKQVATPSRVAANMVSGGVDERTCEANEEARKYGIQDTDGVDIDLQGREVIIYLHSDTIKKLPALYQERAAQGGAVVKLCPVLFTQGIDIQQSMATTFGNSAPKGQMKSADLQHHVNTKGLRDINQYCCTSIPVEMNTRDAAASHDAQIHPLVHELHSTILKSSLTLKNVDLLIQVERLCLMLGGCRVTFCKSGKDRTGMALTLEQSRQLGERYGCGSSQARELKDADAMRLYGVRLLVAEKNIGRKVFSINKLQAQFLPVMFRPPAAVCEDIMKKDNS